MAFRWNKFRLMIIRSMLAKRTRRAWLISDEPKAISLAQELLAWYLKSMSKILYRREKLKIK